MCCLLKGSPHRKHFFLEPVEPVGEEELEFCSLETLDFLDFYYRMPDSIWNL